MRYAVLTVVALLIPSSLDLIPWISISVPVSEPYASWIAEDMEEIVERGWGIMQPGAFYHGHLLLSPEAAVYPHFDSFEQALALSVGALYHTDEQVVRWQAQAHLPPSERTPRSLLAFWDSGPMPAHRFIPDPEETAWHYASHGTIHEWDLSRVRPDLFYDSWMFEVRNGRGRCLTVLQFNVHFAGPVRGGIEVDGRRYGLHFSCRPGSPYE